MPIGDLDMKVDIHTMPGVVVIRSVSGTILWSAPTVIALKNTVRLAFERSNDSLPLMPLTDEKGELTTMKEWAKV